MPPSIYLLPANLFSLKLDKGIIFLSLCVWIMPTSMRRRKQTLKASIYSHFYKCAASMYFHKLSLKNLHNLKNHVVGKMNLQKIFNISKGIYFSIVKSSVWMHFFLNQQTNILHSIVPKVDNLLIRITSK